MKRRAIIILGAALFVAAGLGLSVRPAGGGGLDETDEALSIDTSNCTGPASTPACASRSWWLCQRQRDPALCAAVGVENVVFFDGYEYDENGDLIYPEGAEGRLLFGFGFKTHDLIAVREVGPERFRCYAFGYVEPPNVPDELIGTHEVMLGHELYISEFYRRDGDRWVLVSWTDHGLDCEYEHEFVRVDCRMRVYIESWIYLHDRGGKWRVRQLDR